MGLGETTDPSEPVPRSLRVMAALYGHHDDWSVRATSGAVIQHRDQRGRSQSRAGISTSSATAMVSNSMGRPIIGCTTMPSQERQIIQRRYWLVP